MSKSQVIFALAISLLCIVNGQTNLRKSNIDNFHLALFELLFLADPDSCENPGECYQSTFIGDTTALTVEQCKDDCKKNQECQYFTWFDDSTHDCLMFSDCNYDATACSDCYTGSVNCVVDFWSDTYIMIAGGTDAYSPISDTEVIDMQAISTCPNLPPELPYRALQATVINYNGNMVVCSGLLDNSPDCYSFHDGQWHLEAFKLSPGRYETMDVEIRPGEWLIMGGHNDEFGFLSETKRFKDGIFTDGPEMPYESGGGSAVMLNETHVFVALGEPGLQIPGQGFYLNNYLLDINTNQWTEIANRTIQSTTYHASGTFYNSTAGEVQVAFIGWNGIEVYSPRDDAWHSGIPFPSPIRELSETKAIQQGRNSFILIGGEVGPDYEMCGHIFLFDENGLSTLKEDVLSLPRGGHAAMAISKKDFICQ